MGFMGTYVYAEGEWREDLVPGAPMVELPPEPWMYIDIFDSDMTTVRYAPHDGAAGEAFLGITRKRIADDPEAEAPTDPDREAEGLAAWAGGVTGRLVDRQVIRPFLAADDDEERDEDYYDEADDVEVFVEIKTVQFLSALGLSLPADLGGIQES
jgi:hypothetical protein